MHDQKQQLTLLISTQVVLPCALIRHIHCSQHLGLLQTVSVLDFPSVTWRLPCLVCAQVYQRNQIDAKYVAMKFTLFFISALAFLCLSSSEFLSWENIQDYVTTEPPPKVTILKICLIKSSAIMVITLPLYYHYRINYCI